MIEPVAEPEGIQADAEYFAENNGRFWHTLYRLRRYCAENGPVTLAGGRRVGIFADGVDYDTDAIADIVPALVSRMSCTFDGTKPEIERVLSLVTEDVPSVELSSVKHTIDRPALEGMIRAGGETAERLKATKTLKSKLKVVA